MTLTLEEIWPIFGLKISTPKLELIPLRDKDLPGLAEAALKGIHSPESTPFGSPWTDAKPEELTRNLISYQWSLRNKVTPNNWTIVFGIHYKSQIIGVQDLSVRDFKNRLTVNSGSWLTQEKQGIGLGTEMRAGVLMFAFDVLGAEWAESSAAAWNKASLAVSQKLGYELNGITRVSPRDGQPEDEQRVRLSKTNFKRPSWDIKISGYSKVLTQLGI